MKNHLHRYVIITKTSEVLGLANEFA